MGSIQSIMTSFHFQLGLSSLLWDQFDIQLGLSSLLWVQLIFQLGLSRLLRDQLMNWTHNQLDGPYQKWSQIDIPQVGSSKGTKSDCLDSIFCNNCSPTNSKLSFHVSRRSFWTAVSIFLELTYSNAVSSSEKKMVWVTLDCSQGMVTLHGHMTSKGHHVPHCSTARTYRGILAVNQSKRQSPPLQMPHKHWTYFH
jgi:hypothetical protein